MVVRDGAQGVEVFMLRRVATMAFAPRMMVFPGGGVDSRDGDAQVPWAGPPVSEWAALLEVDETTARELVAAAVREVFEECGVLLAGPSADEVVADTTGDDWEADRVALESRELSLTDFLAGRGLVLRTDLLGAWSAWTTPEFEPRRFRTWFFVAELPAGQRTRDVSSESDEVTWLTPDRALDLSDAGTIGLMPPTYLTLLDLSTHPEPRAVLDSSHDRVVEMFMPTLVDGEAPYLSTPPEYDARLAARQQA
jgi:8-oxo-dGTP pyrophosphatase MutT (NUDIX family)